jgi:hypothetical protein
MPTILRHDQYRFFFYSSDRRESPHVHVERDGLTAKVWLYPTRVAHNHGFRNAELARIVLLTMEHRIALRRGWDEFFAN